MSHPSWARFVRRIWKAQQQDGYAFLSWFDEDHTWHEQPFEVRGGKVLELELPNEGADVYFAPVLFSEPKRRKEFALPGRWLYADLDEVDPRSLELTPPTVAWETSPGRYQAAWELEALLKVHAVGSLNQALTYFTGADKGGWSLTKVLRVPGTISTKYGSEWEVRLMWDDGPSFATRDIKRILKDTPITPNASAPRAIRVPRMSPAEVRRKHRGKLSASARKLLRATEARGDRSQTLWKLENLLLDAGLTPGETFILVKASVWNKYRGQQRENRQLWAEIHKAAAQERTPAKAKKKAKENGQLFQPIDFADFLTKPLPRPSWLVEDIWSEKGHGFLAGQAKTYKSLFTLDLAISIASGTPFLDRFRVPKTGPVLIIQEENEPGLIQDRLHRIAHSRGVGASANGTKISFGEDLPVKILNNAGFNLTDENHFEWLRRTVKAMKPELIVLDPLYLMTPGIDENSATEMTPILSELLDLKQSHDCGILIVHHFNKPTAEKLTLRQGHRISGTSVFNRWFSSALFIDETDEEGTVHISGQHRAHAPSGGYNIKFDLGTDEDLHYEVDITNVRDERIKKFANLKELVAEAGSKGVTLSELADGVGLDRRTVQRRAATLGLKVTRRRVGNRRQIVVTAGK
jgi:hypothetical protein